MKLIRFILLPLLMLAGAPALAQIGSQGGPLDITADRLEVFDTEQRAIFTGNVDAAQGDANLRSDQLEVFFAAREDGGASTALGWGEVDRVIASGDVFYVTPDEVARGDRAVYELTSNTIVMTGEVVLRRCNDVITGTSLTVNLDTGRYQINAPGASESGGRVRLYLTPSGGDEPADDECGSDG